MRGNPSTYHRELAHAEPQARARDGRMKFAILWSIFKKDTLSVAPIIALSAVLFLGDALIERLNLLSMWTMYRTPVLLAALAMLMMSIFQLDSPASLTDDWLCRPIRKRELLAA